MTPPKSDTDPQAALLVNDTFAVAVPPGRVIGSQSTDGSRRFGVDAEQSLSIDNGALRIPPLIEAGWGRAGIAYGPFPRQNGLAVAVSMLNGHNTSQLDEFTDTIKRRLWRWAQGSLSGSEPKTKVIPRMLRWLTSGQAPRIFWWLRWWRKLRSIAGTTLLLDENMAVGWFTEAHAQSGQLPAGNAFVMHALGGANGELWASGGQAPLPAVSGYQNIPTQYVIVLREHGAAYYAASLDKAFGVAGYPALRPLAIESNRTDPSVYAGVQQSVLGQIGFRSDTRVSGVKVGSVSEWATWYGSAHGADQLTGTGTLTEAAAETGQPWTLVRGQFERGAQGATGIETDNLALIAGREPSGLLHAVIETSAEQVGEIGLVWRAVDGASYWSLRLSETQTQLVLTDGGRDEIIATTDGGLRPNSMYSVQILDDGLMISAFVDGKLLFGRRVTDERHGSAVGVGVLSHASASRIRAFEAHPRTVPIPAALDLGAPWSRTGQRVVVTETFDGAARELVGKPTTSGGQVWQRSRGSGMIDLLGDGTAIVRATSTLPNPGRTLFTVDWAERGFAELEAVIRPPDQSVGGEQKGRCGVVFWQDADNYIIVSTYLDSWHPTSSISSFFRIRGYEEVYDAIWTNLDRHVTWGQDYRLRVSFDGQQYLVWANDEPVLYRALTDVYPKQAPLTITRVGLTVNWEWGDDTGSVLKKFVAKA